MKKYLLMAVVAIVTYGSASGVAIRSNRELHELAAKPVKTDPDYKKIASYLKQEPALFAEIQKVQPSTKPADEVTVWSQLVVKFHQPSLDADNIAKIANLVSQLPKLRAEVLSVEPKQSGRMDAVKAKVGQFNKWAQDHKKQMTAAVKSHPWRTVGIVAGVLGTAAAAALFGHYVGYGTIARMLPNFIQTGISKIAPSFATTNAAAAAQAANALKATNVCKVVDAFTALKAADALKAAETLKAANASWLTRWISTPVGIGAGTHSTPSWIAQFLAR